MKLGIGIDTGGTYTDAVIYDFDSGAILGSAKALTTRQDLTVGILGAIDALPADLAEKTEVISLSTTLATNACVEGKCGRAKLIFFGGDRQVIDKLGSQYGLPPSEELYIQESFTTFSGDVKREPDWEEFRRRVKTGFEDLDGVGIIEINAMRNGAGVEKKAREIFKQQHDLPVVCGHELFSELNCLQRGSSTLLNAGLFPVISEFLVSVKEALAAIRISPKALVIVRSDGSLMSEEFAALRPVETLLCGPAASTIGCAHLTHSPNSIVVDMGGTTTDIALIRDGSPVKVTGGVSIGKWKTYVSGLYVKTLGLGGDSAVHYRGEQLYLEEYRVIPLCVAAKKFPQVTENLRRLEKRRHTKFLYEHFLLIRDITGSSRYTREEQNFCSALKNGPLLITQAAQAVGKDIYTLHVERLLKDGVVQLCGLTPTDIMHVKGDFADYDAEASRLGAEFAAFNLGIDLEELCDRVYGEVKQKLYLSIVKALLENKYPDYMKNGVGTDVERFITAGFREAQAGTPDPLLSTVFHSDYTLVGVGAPVGVFLEDVATMLGTHAVFPENHRVANALGAIVGSVSATCTLEIQPTTNADDSTGYVVFSDTQRAAFEDLESAIAYATVRAEVCAKEEAQRRGATGSVTITSHAETQEGSIRGGTVYLGTKVTAHAMGALGF